MNNSSDDEIARDVDNVQNKIPGKVNLQLSEIQNTGMTSKRLKMFESELKGNRNHNFILKLDFKIFPMSTKFTLPWHFIRLVVHI